MKLLTEEIRRKIPPLYSQENVKDPIVHVKFFTPWTNWTWYATEFDGKDVFFGWVVGLEKELGYFSLSEMESIRGPGGIGIERDMYFTSKPLSQVMAEHGEKWLMPQVRPPLKTDKKGPLFPHVPKSRVPLFPHVPKGQKVEYLPQTEKLKHFWVEENKPYGTWAVVEAFPGGTVRSPFDTKEEAIKREREIGVAYEWNLKQVPSPQEKFPKQHEVLKGFYPYEIIEYHNDGDLTIQSFEPLPRPKVGFKKGAIFVVTTDGKIFKQERLPATTETLPFTIKEPVLLPAVAEGTYAWLIIDPETGEIMIKPGYATVDKARRSVRDFAVRRARYAGEHAVEVRIYDREPDIDDLASGVIFKGELRLPEGTIVEEPTSRVLEQLTKDVCYDFRAVRSVVMKHAWELMEKERQPFRTAIKRSWDEVKRQCLKLGAVV